MFDWSSYRGSLSLERSVEEDAARRRARQLSVKYWPLYDYLEHRYASTVVLTFGQIEDLVDSIFRMGREPIRSGGPPANAPPTLVLRMPGR